MTVDPCAWCEKELNGEGIVNYQMHEECRSLYGHSHAIGMWIWRWTIRETARNYRVMNMDAYGRQR